jgi:uncharacterized protein (TIGR01777 family)
MIVAITGATGLVGTALTKALTAEGHTVRPIVRRPGAIPAQDIRWDPAAGTIDATRFNDVDAVVHLAGEGIASHRWTPAVKERIRESRAKGTRLLCETLASLSVKPSVLVSASAVGYYGDRGDEPLDESSTPGQGFLAEVCQEWEAATQPARDANIRVVNLRIGMVLSKKGGALAKMLTPFRLGIGGILGTGQQYVSWITLDDLVRAIIFALNASALSGPVNATAPEPVTNREFTKTLGHVLHRPTVAPMPAFAARILFGEMADEILLSGNRALPRALENARFTFQNPQLEPALRHVLGRV